MKVTDRFAASLAQRLAGVDVENVVEDAYDIVVEDAVEILRGELAAEGASSDVVGAVQLIPENRYLHATVGVPGDHPAADEAEAFEYGSVDGAVRPHGVFRAHSPLMVAGAAEEIAARLEAVIRG